MSQSQPTALPSFYGERSKDGTTIRRPSEEESDALLRSHDPQPPDEARVSKDRRDTSTLGPLAFEDDAPVRRSESRRPNNEVMRWMPNRDYGRPWDDRRARYANYRSPYYRDEYDDPDYELRPRHSPRRSAPPISLYSRYGSVRGPPPRQYSRPLPPKSDYYSEDEYADEEYMEEIGAGGAGGGGRGGNRGHPPLRERGSSEMLRLPWTMWMNSDAKNREHRNILEEFGANSLQIL